MTRNTTEHVPYEVTLRKHIQKTTCYNRSVILLHTALMYIALTNHQASLGLNISSV